MSGNKVKAYQSPNISLKYRKVDSVKRNQKKAKNFL